MLSDFTRKMDTNTKKLRTQKCSLLVVLARKRGFGEANVVNFVRQLKIFRRERRDPAAF